MPFYSTFRGPRGISNIIAREPHIAVRSIFVQAIVFDDKWWGMASTGAVEAHQKTTLQGPCGTLHDVIERCFMFFTRYS
jgi:hypothetical protein